MIHSRTELRQLHHSLTRLNYTRIRMEGLFQNRQITLTDLESVYEALFLRAVTSFEVYLEDLFLAILEQRTRYAKKRVKIKMTTNSRDDLMSVLLEGDNYMRWLPYAHTERRAKAYLKDGRPFTELDNGDRSIIKTITTIRNAIAHKSPHAMAEFRRTVIGSMPLLRGERSPAGFLRSQASSGNVRRFEIYAAALGNTGSTLS